MINLPRLALFCVIPTCNSYLYSVLCAYDKKSKKTLRHHISKKLCQFGDRLQNKILSNGICQRSEIFCQLWDFVNWNVMPCVIFHITARYDSVKCNGRNDLINRNVWSLFVTISQHISLPDNHKLSLKRPKFNLLFWYSSRNLYILPSKLFNYKAAIKTKYESRTNALYTRMLVKSFQVNICSPFEY